MSNLEKIKQIAEDMPDSPEKQQALQAYENLKTFEIIADSFDSLLEVSRVHTHSIPPARLTSF